MKMFILLTLNMSLVSYAFKVVYLLCWYFQKLVYVGVISD